VSRSSNSVPECSVFLGCYTVSGNIGADILKPLDSFQMLGITHPLTQYHIQEKLNFQYTAFYSEGIHYLNILSVAIFQ
jgi:hypothetical protein